MFFENISVYVDNIINISVQHDFYDGIIYLSSNILARIPAQYPFYRHAQH